uniref:Uncharacterized protein n=1 Tax=Octopus bimaculoides TaxID=37653 RepID=A0A0L8IHU7_OCTBM
MNKILCKILERNINACFFCFFFPYSHWLFRRYWMNIPEISEIYSASVAFAFSHQTDPWN